MNSRKAGTELGSLLKRQRLTSGMTLQELAAMSSVSPSHLGRIERGERFPSAHTLRRIAKPLDFDEGELFALAGYLSPRPLGVAETEPSYTGVGGRLDPYVAKMLAQEPDEVQRAVIGILSILKSIAKSVAKEGR